jgi:signal transduction histidine kinase
MLLGARVPDPPRALLAVREAIDETRDIFTLVETRPFDWDAAVAELRYELHRGAEAGNLELELAVDGQVACIPPPVRHTLHRVAREALTNVIRHAGAHRIRCALRGSDDAVTLRIADDGRGFGGRSPGRGLSIIRRRAEQLGGTAVFADAEDGGAVVEVTVPVVAAAAPPMNMGAPFVADAVP